MRKGHSMEMVTTCFTHGKTYMGRHQASWIRFWDGFPEWQVALVKKVGGGLRSSHAAHLADAFGAHPWCKNPVLYRFRQVLDCHLGNSHELGWGSGAVALCVQAGKPQQHARPNRKAAVMHDLRHKAGKHSGAAVEDASFPEWHSSSNCAYL